MHSLSRIAVYAALLVGFVVGALFLQNRLQKQTQGQLRALNQAAIETKQHQFQRALDARRLSPELSFTELQAVAESIGATATANRQPGAERSDDRRLSFEHTSKGNLTATISFPAPAASKLLTVYHRVTVGLLLLCPLLFAFGLLIAGVSRRQKEDRSSRPPWPIARAQATGMEQLAKLSHERTQALKLEQQARHRVEENLEVNRTLLDRSLDERVRLGRELHDNICQTLYAVCLTLESVQKKNTLAPELSARVDQCMAELKRVNQEVRAYLQDLEPAGVRSQSFESALRALVETFTARDGVKIEARIDDDAAAKIAPEHVAELLNILREGISNSLRHGHASHITIRAASTDDEIALSLQDNGSGFHAAPNQSATSKGHGLTNMQSRAVALGGSLLIESAPGQGTRLLLTLPAIRTPVA
ncbi:sensor histidine kinase [Oleiharenicola lentus]|uniref:sensor histidine kinase n=1 Tax=Oleiharenicola lentus TaxID=2508720 RepID=UPI003F67C4D6